MKRKPLRFILLIGAISLLAACATKNQVKSIQTDTQRNTDYIHQIFDQFSTTQDSISDINNQLDILEENGKKSTKKYQELELKLSSELSKLKNLKLKVTNLEKEGKITKSQLDKLLADIDEAKKQEEEIINNHNHQWEEINKSTIQRDK